MEQKVLHLLGGEEAERVRALAAQQGVEVRDLKPRGMEVVTTTTVLLVGLPPAIRHILQSIDDFRSGGQIIDLRSGAGVNVHRSKKLRPDLILIYTRDGSFELRVDDQRRSFGEVASRLAERLEPGSSALDVREALKAEEAEDPGSVEVRQEPAGTDQ
jgi:hypothetical protein